MNFLLLFATSELYFSPTYRKVIHDYHADCLYSWELAIHSACCAGMVTSMNQVHCFVWSVSLCQHRDLALIFLDRQGGLTLPSVTSNGYYLSTSQ